MKLITVVYKIVDETEWRKENLILYEHNGLVAQGVEKGNALDAKSALKGLMQFVEDDYDPDFSTPAYKAAVEHAREALNTEEDDAEHDRCPKCGAWTKKTVAESVFNLSYCYCPMCNWTDKPEWKPG